MELFLSQFIQFGLALLLMWVGLMFKGERKRRRDEYDAIIATLKALEKRADRTDDRILIIEKTCHEKHGTITLGDHG